MIELFGIISLVLSVTGVVLNNRKLKFCFLFWIISNILSGYVHFEAHVYSLLCRDIIFTVLAIEGWVKWGKTKWL